MNLSQKSLPTGLSHFKTTPEFTHETIKPGLLKAHKTPDDTYGLLVVKEGSLQFASQEGQNEVIYDVTPQHPLVIEPETLHRVIPKGAVRFHVELYKR